MPRAALVYIRTDAPMEIRLATEVTDALLGAVRRLAPQLSPAAPEPTRAGLEALVASGAARLFLAVEPGGDPEIVGMLTLGSYPLPTGARVWIEDVVVDEASRGRAVGEALVRAALEEARRLGARSVELTSRPERAAANRLYQRLGFQLRETNAYRYRLDP
jgi:ribosomal protein S18 acetylase RimI-like enzyme